MEKTTIDNNFVAHESTDELDRIYASMRSEAKRFATIVNNTCPESREKSLALTKIEEAMFWANAAIARN